MQLREANALTIRLIGESGHWINGLGVSDKGIGTDNRLSVVTDRDLPYAQPINV